MTDDIYTTEQGECFDKLPRAVRDRLNNALVTGSSVEVYQQWELCREYGFTEKMFLMRLDIYLNRLAKLESVLAHNEIETFRKELEQEVKERRQKYERL